MTMDQQRVPVRISYLNDEAIVSAVLDRKVDAGIVSNVGLAWLRRENPQWNVAVYRAPLDAL